MEKALSLYREALKEKEKEREGDHPMRIETSSCYNLFRFNKEKKRIEISKN